MIHPIKPVYNKDSEILILGSFPSVKSREDMFFYAHPQNRFWKVLAALKNTDVPSTVEEKTNFLLKYKIALWDVIKSCEVTGSSDSSIKNVKPNNIKIILDTANIKKIFINGKTADKYYKKYLSADINISALCLPSTSPANARSSLDDLIEKWAVINEDYSFQGRYSNEG